MSAVCYGTIGTVGALRVTLPHCVYIDKDGDKFAIHYSGVAGAGKAEILGGSGKFTGMTGGADVKVTRVPSLPGTISVCSETQWKYALPD